MNYKTNYTITEKMQIDSVKQYFYKCIFGAGVYAILFFLAVSILLFVLPLTRAGFLPIFFLTVSFIFTIIWIKTYFALINQAKIQFKILESNEAQIEINDDEITYKSSNGTRSFKLDKIDQCIECKDFIILRKESIPILNIPKVFINEDVISFLKGKSQGNDLNKISEYFETNYLTKRQFGLFNDELIISVVGAKPNKGVLKIKLININPEFKIICNRSKGFYLSLFLFVISFIFYYVTVFGPKKDAAYCGVAFIFGLIFFFFFIKKIKKAQFLDTAGLESFEIIKRGKSQRQFEDFIAKIVNQIKLFQGSNKN